MVKNAGLFTVVMVLATFVVVVDNTIMNVSINALVNDLNTTISGVQAAISLNALVMAAFVMMGGKLGTCRSAIDKGTKDCLCGGKVEVVEHGAHGRAQGLVVLVDRAPVLGLAAEPAPDGIASARMGSRGEQRLEDVLAEDDQGGDRPEALVEDLIASGVARLLE